MNDSTNEDENLEIVEIPRRDAVWGLGLLSVLAAAFVGSLAYRMTDKTSSPSVLPTSQMVSVPTEENRESLASDQSQDLDSAVTAESLFQPDNVRQDSSVAPATFEEEQ